MKKYLSGLLTGILMMICFTAYAASDIKLIINGQDITATMDVKPQNIDGRVLVPARYVAEALGATVSWDSDKNAVVVTSGKTEPQSPATQTDTSSDGKKIITPNDNYYSFEDIGTGSTWYTKDGEAVQVFVGGSKLTYENFTDQSKSKIVNIQDYYGPEDNLGRRKLYYLKSDIDAQGLPVYTRDAIWLSDKWVDPRDYASTYNLAMSPIMEKRDGLTFVVAYDISIHDVWTVNPTLFRISEADGTLITDIFKGGTYVKKLYFEDQLKKAGLL